jgi:FkbM family methyltransferase
MSNSSIVRNVTRLLSTPGMPGAYSRWLWSSLRYGEGPPVLCANTDIRGWISFSDYWDFHGGISQAQRRLIENRLRRTASSRPIAIDIGAHLGLFTAELAGRGFAQVHAFEPAARTFAKLKANIDSSPSARGAVKLNCAAVGPTNGTVEFQLEPDSPATNHVRLDGGRRNGSTSAQPDRVQQVPMTTLDRYCEECGIEQIDFLKIDTEGLEPYVLDGARECLRNSHISIIVLESCPFALERAGTSVAALHDRLASNGYQPHELEKDGELGAALTVEQLENLSASGSLSACGHGADIVAVPKS